jgi:uncharacterized membrane protein
VIVTLLVIGLIVFLGTHAFSMARGSRASLVGRIGEGPYKGSIPWRRSPGSC